MNKETINAVKCLICGDIIESTHRHDFKTCSCANVSVDGGLDYFKRNIKNEDKYIELLVQTKKDGNVKNCQLIEPIIEWEKLGYRRSINFQEDNEPHMWTTQDENIITYIQENDEYVLMIDFYLQREIELVSVSAVNKKRHCIVKPILNLKEIELIQKTMQYLKKKRKND